VLGLPTGRYILTVEQPGFRLYRQSGITLAARRPHCDGHQAGGRTDLSISERDRGGGAAADCKRRSELTSKREDLRATARRAQFHSLVDACAGAHCPARLSSGQINGSGANQRIHLRRHQACCSRARTGSGLPHHRRHASSSSISTRTRRVRPLEWPARSWCGKSGSNQFHGTLFEFFRNEALNARTSLHNQAPNLSSGATSTG